MMKNILALSLLACATGAFADGAANTQLVPGTTALGKTTVSAVATTFEYETVSKTAAANRKFVKSPFEFTLSANVVVGAIEDPDSRWMIVAAGNDKGRNLFVGHSNGGSVASCGDALTTQEAKNKKPMTNLTGRVKTTEEDGCDPAVAAS